MGELGLECLENQLRKAAEGKSPPDVFCIEHCDNDDKLGQVREIIRRNEKRMVKLSTPNTTGHMIENDFETEVGFDIPAVIIRDGMVKNCLKGSIIKTNEQNLRISYTTFYLEKVN